MPGKSWTAVVVIAAVVMLAGCSPDPEPSPSPTGFATEAEAFAAAEETYRAYFEAGNHLDLSDPTTFEPMLAWTTATQATVERKGLSELHAEGATVSGHASIVNIEPASWDADVQVVNLETCQDVSERELTDANGVSLVSPDRPALQPEVITLIVDDRSPTRLLIDDIDPGEDDSLCAD